MAKIIKNGIEYTGGSGASNITVDEQLDENSTNPVQNKVIANALKNVQYTADFEYATSEEVSAKFPIAT